MALPSVFTLFLILLPSCNIVMMTSGIDLLAADTAEYNGLVQRCGGLDIGYDNDDDTIVDTAREIPWLPYYQMGEWATLEDNKRHITVHMLLLAGTTYKAKEHISVAVEDEGMTLVVKCRVPDFMNETDLETFYSDEPESERSNDFHHQLRTMADCLKEQKERIGLKDVIVVTRIELKFACDTSFKIRNKADDNGARALYIKLDELETSAENNPEEDWPVLKRLPKTSS